MIFNEAYNGNIYSLDGIEESPYELGIGGALMHVYENECNFNAIMKAAALSELKYYNETGGDLFVQEAGAISGLVEKIKAFFKKVIEKIKSIFKKFMTKFDQFRLGNKDFVKKYRKQLVMANLEDLEFDGYKLKDNVGAGLKFDALAVVKTLNEHDLTADVYGPHTNEVKFDTDEDGLTTIMEKNRGSLVDGAGGVTESEFREKLKEALYGDKESYDVTREVINKCLKVIEGGDKDKKDAETAQRKIIDAINKAIKGIDKIADKKADKTTELKGAPQTASVNRVHTLNKTSKVMQAFCNDVTVFYSEYVKAIVDNTKLAKAICTKALTRKVKKESSMYEGGYDDIFAGVEIV